eukprot:gene17607-biopygen42711
MTDPWPWDTTAAWAEGDVIGVAADIGKKEMLVARNGQWETVFTGVAADGLFPAVSRVPFADADDVINFGASDFRLPRLGSQWKVQALRFPPPDESFGPVSTEKDIGDMVMLRGEGFRGSANAMSEFLKRRSSARAGRKRCRSPVEAAAARCPKGHHLLPYRDGARLVIGVVVAIFHLDALSHSFLFDAFLYSGDGGKCDGCGGTFLAGTRAVACRECEGWCLCSDCCVPAARAGDT